MRFLFIFALTISAWSQSVTLAWQYPSNVLASAASNGWPYSFKIYGTNQLGSSFASWQLISSQPATNYPIIGYDGTNYTFAYTSTIAPGQFFYTATASNFWGESVNSNTSSVPSLPLALHTTIQKN